MKANQATDIIYSEDFDNRKGNIIEVSEDFLNYLDREGSITITGQIQDDLIIPTDDKTYKVRGINLPTSMLVVSDNGRIDLQLSHFLKLQDYNHQYHRIYQKIKDEAPQQTDFDNFLLQQLFDHYGIQDSQIKQKYKISLKEFNRFQQFVNFLYIGGKRLFIPRIIMHKYMRNLLMYLTEKQLYNRYFSLQELNEFDCQIKCFNSVNEKMFDLVANKFFFDIDRPTDNEKMELQNQPQPVSSTPRYKISFESILHFVLVQLSNTSPQYRAAEMDNLLTNMLNIYTPTGMELPSQQEKKQLTKRFISRYFIETTRNNSLIRVYYDPLQIEASLKGRIKFMSSFKNRFTRDEIRGVFEGLVIQDSSKEIKQLNQTGGRKSIDMDDLLLKNFRKFNQLYEIKLILPK